MEASTKKPHGGSIPSSLCGENGRYAVKIKILSLCLLLMFSLLCSSCGEREPDTSNRETFPPESYQVVTDATLIHRGGLRMTDYSGDSTVGEWLKKCAASDRDEQFDVYTLRHEATTGEMTTFTYAIYYPHGGESMIASVELLEGENGYILNVTYTLGASSGEYCLDYLSVTLPTDKTPRLRMLYDGDVLGHLATVTDKEI